MTLPFVPDGGLRELYDRTLGYQATRSSPFSVWGQAPVARLPPAGRAGRGGRAGARRSRSIPGFKTPVQIAALAAAVTIAVQLTATHWFYFYVVWFLPFVLVASFASQRGASGAQRDPASSQPPELRRADHDLVAGLQPDARLAGAADAGRGAGGDDVAGLERHQAREVGDQRRDREDQVGGGRLLHPLAVEVERDPDRVVRARPRRG